MPRQERRDAIDVIYAVVGILRKQKGFDNQLNYGHNYIDT